MHENVPRETQSISQQLNPPHESPTPHESQRLPQRERRMRPSDDRRLRDCGSSAETCSNFPDLGSLSFRNSTVIDNPRRGFWRRQWQEEFEGWSSLHRRDGGDCSSGEGGEPISRIGVSHGRSATRSINQSRHDVCGATSPATTDGAALSAWRCLAVYGMPSFLISTLHGHLSISIGMDRIIVRKGQRPECTFFECELKHGNSC